jgi:signal transduction histidine kinase/CheY-like chemotaxis protein
MLEDIDKEKRARDELLKKADKLTKQLKSAAAIYISICDLDIRRNDVTPIRNQNPAIASVVNSCDHNMQDLFFGIMRGLPESPTKQAAIKFCDLSDIDERMKDTNTVTLEYISYGNIWVRARYVVSERDEDGSVTHVLWMLENIDAEKKARDKLVAMTETLNKQIMSVADIYITVHDIDIVNNTFIEIKNTTRKVTDIMRRDMQDAQNVLYNAMHRVTDPSSGDEVREFIDLSTVEKRMTGTDSILIEYLSDEKTWRRGRFVVSERDEKGRITHVLWMVEDIDKEKKSRERLIDMSERAIAANEAKSAFLSNMSHEIRTPINALLGMNEMVLRECEDKNIISYSENIRTAGTTLLGLINDILDFSKIEAGKMEIIPVDYDLATVLKDLVNMIKTRAEAKDLQVLTDFDKETPQYLKGDEVRLKQIITNILTNAVKYTEQGGITFSVGFERIAHDNGSIMLCISVKDTGIGIKPEDMEKLFSKFERIEEKRNRNIEGTGLGMNITQSLLELMGSRLEVESTYGEGSTFSFRIRQTVRKWDALGNYKDAYKRSVSSRSKYKESFTAPDAKVLVVDDMPMNILVFTSLLKQTGVQIDTAENGDDAVALAMKNQYDVIFLDHMMPNKDGIETLKEIKADEKALNINTPTICLTANAISGAREKYIDAGFDDYLTKPIESDKLEEMLYEYLPHDKILRSAVIEQQVVESEDRIPDFLFAITEIDIVTGIKYCGSEKLYLNALRSYAKSIGSYLFRLKKYWITGSVKDTLVMVHNIKSSSRTIGAEWISNLALAIETAASINDSNSMEENLELLIERCKRLGEQLHALTRDEV